MAKLQDRDGGASDSSTVATSNALASHKQSEQEVKTIDDDDNGDEQMDEDEATTIKSAIKTKANDNIDEVDDDATEDKYEMKYFDDYDNLDDYRENLYDDGGEKTINTTIAKTADYDAKVAADFACKKSSIASITGCQKRSKTFDHAVAQEFYKKSDPDKGFFNNVKDEIHEIAGKYPLYRLMIDLGAECVHCETHVVIHILEAIYEALDKEHDFIKSHYLHTDTRDELFEVAITWAYKEAKHYNKTNILTTLDNIYHLNQSDFDT